jgi:hypothetical protein
MKRGSGISEGEEKTQAPEARLPRRLMDIGIILLPPCAVRPLPTRWLNAFMFASPVSAR